MVEFLAQGPRRMRALEQCRMGMSGHVMGKNRAVCLDRSAEQIEPLWQRK